MLHNEYKDVITRFLRKDERLVLSDETEMPLVIEAKGLTDLEFLHQFLTANSEKLLEDISTYGAVLLRGFNVASDVDFEKTVLSIQGFRGISDAFMSEEGRIYVDHLKYVLHTNAVYKTGGTLYLGGFHSENYYSADVPGYICFYCAKPSDLGGETGLVNMEKIYRCLSDDLKQRLEKKSFFVSKWLVSEVAERYQISSECIEKICHQFDLPIVGEGKRKLILMYKPSVWKHSRTQRKALQINQFEILGLNAELQKCFMNDYKGNTWFWHRFVWKLPKFIFRQLEVIAIACFSFFYSPLDALKILRTKLKTKRALKHCHLPPDHQEKVGQCFNTKEVSDLAQLMRKYYSSCLWKKGDVLLVDNQQVVHAGMPGSGPRLIRAMIGNPIEMNYSLMQPGLLDCHYRMTETIGYYMQTGQLNL